MVIFPIISAVLAAACAVVIGRDALRRPRADKRAWAIAFTMFALAAGADAFGREFGWNAALARVYYATGPALVVAWLAIGELYLLAPRRMGRFAPGAAILISAVWVTLVLDAPIDAARLPAEGWEAMDRSGAIRLASISINAVGTFIIVGGLLWSVWRFQRKSTHRNRMIGCSLIAAGTVTVAMGGTLTRLGQYEYLYIAMSAGVALIFAGVLRTRRAEVGITAVVGVSAAEVGMAPVPTVAPGPGDELATPVMAATEPETAASGPELAFLATSVLPLRGDALAVVCRAWSVEIDPDPAMSRRDARQGWRLRRSLSRDDQANFDALSVPERRAVVELAAEVLHLPVLTRVDDPAPPRGGSVRSGD